MTAEYQRSADLMAQLSEGLNSNTVPSYGSAEDTPKLLSCYLTKSYEAATVPCPVATARCMLHTACRSAFANGTGSASRMLQSGPPFYLSSWNTSKLGSGWGSTPCANNQVGALREPSLLAVPAGCGTGERCSVECGAVR